ncbi:UBA domain-containing protein 7 [Termitomyces sp. T112]|nr:UBA domain-containing protein 7 [Termitomyces sp. T112]
MSDSFADLWNSSAPPAKSVPRQKLGSLSTKNALKPAQPDVFLLLSSAGPSNSSSKSMSPVITGETSQRTTTPATKSLSNSGGDAFSGLLSGSLTANTNDNTRMTMAERVAEAERQKSENLRRHEETIKTPTSSVWEGLDSLAMTSTQPVPLSSSKSKQVLLDDDWGLDAFASQVDMPTTEDGDWLIESANKPEPQLESISPPPHVLGRIVEMGFSVQQARIALAATDTGLDVQAALETLLEEKAASDVPPVQFSPQSLDHVPASHSVSYRMSHDRQQGTTSRTSSQQDIREQADRFIAHASEIGMNIFSKASSFWQEGKERVQKVYVERAAGAEQSNGRPRWMTGQASRRNEEPWQNALRDPGVQFSDEAGPITDKIQPHRQQPQQERAPEPKPKSAIADLSLENPHPTIYISPFRRRTSAVTGTAPSPASTSRTTPPPARVVVRSSSPLRERANLVSASPSVLATAHTHKEAGSEKFKLGQYAEADAAYSLGIDALPPGHLLLVPLHNNRALARLRTGDHIGAIADAGVVLDLIGAEYHPQREAKVQEEADADVDLGGALVKALKRRAEAWEGREKWEEAAKDWGVLAGLEWAEKKTRGEAAGAAGRCRKMIRQNKQADTGDTVPKPVTSKPRPRPPVTPASLFGSAVPSQALENLRTINNAAEVEDQLRHELKDSVDAKLLAWKGGKETNIRALLGSIDIVLWPELGLQKVGMAELVTPAQVKIKYTRTIAKLHPDKLNSGNTTVEQRMIANGVFGALNEAWMAFKQ